MFLVFSVCFSCCCCFVFVWVFFFFLLGFLRVYFGAESVRCTGLRGMKPSRGGKSSSAKKMLSACVKMASLEKSSRFLLVPFAFVNLPLKKIKIKINPSRGPRETSGVYILYNKRRRRRRRRKTRNVSKFLRF